MGMLGIELGGKGFVMNEQFTIGKVLGTGFRVWGKNFIPFFVITAMVYLPLIIPLAIIAQGHMDIAAVLRIADISKFSVAFILLLNIMAGAALTYGVVMDLQGQRASFGACIATGIRRFLPALGVALLSALCIGVGIIGVFVGAVIVYCMLYVSTQASVIEKPGIIGALKRSRFLTAGYRVQIFGMLFVLGLINFAATKLVENIALPDAAHMTQQQVFAKLPAYIYADLLRAVLVGSLMSVMAAVTYFYLRQEKEGTSAAELGQVFA
ncbi:MAG: hypothetical protein K8W52_06335 [Deltaproteobacteria bacterium]|nr:hypothetical protein [Deltaproteobacteria bacterium]